MKPTLQLYRNAIFGHCHRFELFLSLLGPPFESIDVDLASEGGLSLQPYPAIRAWLARIEALPGFVPMAKTPVGWVA